MKNNGLGVNARERRLHCVFEPVQVGGKTYLRQLSCALPYKEMQAGELGAELPDFDVELDSGTGTVYVYRLIRQKAG